MRHLDSDDLIDLAEGTRPESSFPHLGSCEACRRQLAHLRAAMAAASEVDVPEPSPLFWDHFSAHVREAIEREGGPRRLGWLIAPLSIGAIAVLVVAAVVTMRFTGTTPVSGVAPPPAIAEAGSIGEPEKLANDPSLELVADLAADVDWDAASEAGITPRPSAVDRAVNQLTEAERRELERLLKETLAHSSD